MIIIYLQIYFRANDESIQIFSNRGSQVIDVLLDFSSVCVGLLVVLAIYAVAKKAKKNV